MTATPEQIGPSASCSSAELELALIEPRDIQTATPYVWPLLLEVTSRPEVALTPVEVLLQCQRGQMQLWVVIRGDPNPVALLVSRVARSKKRKWCELLLCAGRGVHLWKDKLREIEKWAKDQGCGMMELHGRPGWARLYPDYTESYRVLAREL